jgi:DNA-binding transcriptional LysR family regulator
MDVRRLALLAAVAEHGSVTRAASALKVSQPALSRQITALELEAGMRLLVRGPGGVTPTPAGHALVRRGEAIAAHGAAGEREIAQLRSGGAGYLRIVAFPSAAATLALDAMTALRKTHPNVTVTVEERDRAEALRLVRRGQAEIAITFAERPGSRLDLLASQPLLTDEMLVALPADDPRLGSPLRLYDLRDDGWILGTSGSGLITHACAAAGFTPRVVSRLDQQPAIQAAVAAGIGVTLIPELAARHLQPGLATRRFVGAPVRHVAAHTLEGPMDPVAAVGLEALAAAAGSVAGSS